MSTASKTIVAELHKDNRLNGNNYDIWAIKVWYMLEGQDALNPWIRLMSNLGRALPLNIGSTVKPMLPGKRRIILLV